MLAQIRKQNGARVLKLIQKGPTHIDVLSNKLYISKIEIGYAIYELKKEGIKVESKNEIIQLRRKTREDL